MTKRDLKKEYEQYFTHKDLAECLAKYILKCFKDDLKTATILEPSAGHGALIDAIIFEIQKHTNEEKTEIQKRITCYDIDERNIAVLKNKYSNIKIIHEDFLLAKIENKFDIIIMNPPWSKFTIEKREFFEPFLGRFTSKGLSAKEKDVLYNDFLSKNNMQNEYVFWVVEKERYYKKIKMMYKNCYSFETCFFKKALDLLSERGFCGQIGTEHILNDNKSGELREILYQKLRYLFKFHNELQLFEDIHDQVKYVMNIFGKHSKEKFILVDNLFHPETIEHSFCESKEAPYPGMKNKEGKWELRGHPLRIVEVNQELLEKISVFTGSENPWQTILPTLHGTQEKELFLKLSKLPKLKSIEYCYSQGMNETNSPKAGLISRAPTSHPLEETVLTGPNLFVGNPCYKEPNEGCKNNQDFSLVDLESLPEDFVPKSVYVLTEKGKKSEEYLRKTPWGTVHNFSYRMAARRMLNTTGVRTLSNALLPPYMGHISGIISLSFSNSLELLLCTGVFHSLLSDFLLRNITAAFYDSTCKILPIIPLSCKENTLVEMLLLRTLRLNALSSHYASLYEEVFPSLSLESKKMDLGKLYLECMDSSFSSFENLKKKECLSYSKLPSSWNKEVSLRVIEDREQALCEIDALTSLLFGISKDTLLNLYRSQFAVLQKNLQDFEDQKPQEGKRYFPRYEVMKKAYEIFESYMKANNILTIQEEIFFIGDIKNRNGH